MASHDRDKAARDDAGAASGARETSGAAAPGVASLLTDLLSEAKKDIAVERQALEAQQRSREAEERDRALREEARRREEMQRQLVEETRLRNEALARRDRSKDRASPGTARHERPAPVALTEAPATVGSSTSALPTPRKGVGVWLVAALIVVGAGAGAAVALLSAPKPALNWPNVDVLARGVVEQTIKAAQATGAVERELAEARSRIARLEGQITAAVAGHKALQGELEATREALATAQQELEDAAAGSTTTTTRTRRRRTTTDTDDTVPKLSDDIFK